MDYWCGEECCESAGRRKRQMSGFSKEWKCQQRGIYLTDTDEDDADEAEAHSFSCIVNISSVYRCSVKHFEKISNKFIPPK